MPRVFTESGVYMLMTVLRGEFSIILSRMKMEIYLIYSSNTRNTINDIVIERRKIRWQCTAIGIHGMAALSAARDANTVTSTILTE